MDPRLLQPTDPLRLKAAFADLGLREVKGAATHPRIGEMYKAAGASPDMDDSRVSWCSAAMNDWVKKEGLAGTNSLLGKSWDALPNARKLDIAKTLPRAAILMFRYSGVSWQAHVCMLLADLGDRLVVIGANQGGERENGGGVTIMTWPRAALIAAVWPVGALSSRVAQNFIGSGASQVGGSVAGGGADYLESAAAPASHIAANGDKISEGLTQAQELAMQAAQYLRWAQYALVAIGIALALYGFYRFVKGYLRPQEMTDIGTGAGVPPPEGLDIDMPTHAPRRKRKPTRGPSSKPKTKRKRRAGS